MGRPGIRCVAIYWKQLRLTLDLCFLSYPIWNLTSWRSRGETTFTIIYIHLLSVFLLTSARPNSNKCILQQYSSSKLGAQAIPLKNLVSRTGEGHSIQILSVATLQAKRIVYSPSNTLIDWLTYYLWSLIPTFPGLRPRAIFVRGVHRGAFAQQQLRSRDVTVARRLVQRRHTSGAEADAVRRTTEVVGMLSSMPVQPTNERWMFWIQHLQTVQSKIYSHTITNTSNKFHGMLFPTNYLQWNAVYY